MKIDIDPDAGFCNGVVRAIQKAEEALEKEAELYCLGDIVHNEEEIARLHQKGLQIITPDQFFQHSYPKVLIRAHGEPPDRYRYAQHHGITLIDATCPIVIRLQQQIKQSWDDIKVIDGQIVLFAKKNHAETIALNGQIENQAIIVEDIEDIGHINFSKPIRLFSQTTKNAEDFQQLTQTIVKNAQALGNDDVIAYNTTCRFVAKRSENVAVFAKNYDVIIFVSGRKSSNGKYLYEICQAHNSHTYMISSPNNLQKLWFEDCSSVGITGATSTPQWLMKLVAETIEGIV